MYLLNSGAETLFLVPGVPKPLVLPSITSDSKVRQGRINLCLVADSQVCSALHRPGWGLATVGLCHLFTVRQQGEGEVAVQSSSSSRIFTSHLPATSCLITLSSPFFPLSSERKEILNCRQGSAGSSEIRVQCGPALPCTAVCSLVLI